MRSTGPVGEGACGKAIKLAVNTLNHTSTTTNRHLRFTVSDFFSETPKQNLMKLCSKEVLNVSF